MYSVARACDAGHVNTKVSPMNCCNIASKAALSNSEYFSLLYLRFVWNFFPPASGRRRTVISIGKAWFTFVRHM